MLELRAALPVYERPNRLIADIVKTILDAQDRDWEDFGSTTFRKVQKAGLEPDTCFYIQHAEQMRMCDRVDPDRDPPPDLAIESDVTSKTTLETYGLLQMIPQLLQQAKQTGSHKMLKQLRSDLTQQNL